MSPLILRAKGTPAEGSCFITATLEDGTSMTLHIGLRDFVALAGMMQEHLSFVAHEQQRIAMDLAARRN